jgi:hypothetical protein
MTNDEGRRTKDEGRRTKDEGRRNGGRWIGRSVGRWRPIRTADSTDGKGGNLASNLSFQNSRHLCHPRSKCFRIRSQIPFAFIRVIRGQNHPPHFEIPTTKFQINFNLQTPNSNFVLVLAINLLLPLTDLIGTERILTPALKCSAIFGSQSRRYYGTPKAAFPRW